MPTAIRNGQFEEVEDNDIDYVLDEPGRLVSNNASLIPLHGNVAAARIFYGARFFNQALPLDKPEVPLVQSLKERLADGTEISFDDHMGKLAGAIAADEDSEVEDANDDFIQLRTATGRQVRHPLYRNFSFNRKSEITQTPVVKKGDRVLKGGLLAKSNYTDDKGALAMGLNSRVALVPYKGHSMDDALVISESFAKKLRSRQAILAEQEFDDEIKGGRDHFVSVFPTKFTKDQFGNLDEDGVAKPGTILKQGDPMILATGPRTATSSELQAGRISRVMSQMRRDASQTWDYEDDAEVVDVVKNKKNGKVKVLVKWSSPTKESDKVIYRSGQKGIVSKLVPDEQMLRDANGQPFEVLLNPLSVPSRVNPSMIYEILLGKLAAKRGAPLKMPAFNTGDHNQLETIKKMLADAGMAPEEKVFDPMTGKWLDQPVLTGSAYAMKLLHMGEGKSSSRGVSGYDQYAQPARGGGENAKAKRLSGLEHASLRSSGAYATQRESVLLRGSKNEDYWRAIREGRTPPEPGKPFVWDAFLQYLKGAGLNAKDVGGGNLRIGPHTDKQLQSMNPVEIKNGEIVEFSTLEPVAGGLFDPSLVGNNRVGKISLDTAVPNPAFADVIRALLGITKAQFEDLVRK